MRSYLDSSALVKVFVLEDGRDEVIGLLATSGLTSTSRLTYVECQAALARAYRERRLTQDDKAWVSRSLDQRWPDLVIVEIDEVLTRQAAELAHRLPLRQPMPFISPRLRSWRARLPKPYRLRAGIIGRGKLLRRLATRWCPRRPLDCPEVGAHLRPLLAA